MQTPIIPARLNTPTHTYIYDASHIPQYHIAGAPSGKKVPLFPPFESRSRRIELTTLADAGIVAKISKNMPAGSAATPPSPFVGEHDSATDGIAGDTDEVQNTPEAFGWLPHSMAMSTTRRSGVDNVDIARGVYTFQEVGAACSLGHPPPPLPALDQIISIW